MINQIDPIAVVFTLPGDAVQAINRAQRSRSHLPVLVYGRDGGALLARGELILVNNQIDTTSGTVQLKARFANADHVLWPGQYVNVRLRARRVLERPDGAGGGGAARRERHLCLRRRTPRQGADPPHHGVAIQDG